jgi:succinate-semialdehyde dehydrogenase / glutarate-semialdehyde dehydrogenase
MMRARRLRRRGGRAVDSLEFRFSEEAQVIAQANDTPFGFTSYLYTRDISRAFRVAEALEFGMVGINAGTVSTTTAPFGGVKR